MGLNSPSTLTDERRRQLLDEGSRLLVDPRWKNHLARCVPDTDGLRKRLQAGLAGTAQLVLGDAIQVIGIDSNLNRRIAVQERASRESHERLAQMYSIGVLVLLSTGLTVVIIQSLVAQLDSMTK